MQSLARMSYLQSPSYKKLANSNMAKLALVFRVITITVILRLASSLESSSTTPIQPALPPSNPCIPSERDALLEFRKGLTDPDSYLSSWQGDGCCAWTGISCSKRNGHIVVLWLRFAGLGGTISSALLGLRHLKFLSLKGNDFGGAQIPKFIGSFKHLQYLSLSDANFSGQIPPHFGNLSELIHLHVNSMEGPKVYSDLAWLPRLSKLSYLELNGVNLSTAIDWAHSLSMLPSLVYLSLIRCSLRNTIPPPVHINLTSLEEVYLNGNPFNSPVSVKHFFWPFWALPRLEIIFLVSCGLQGSLPEVLGNSTSLAILYLNSNDLTGIPITFKKLHTLESLYLAQNNINGDIQELLERLPRHSLHDLVLYSNNLTGSLPSQKGYFRDLRTLYLSDNRIFGDIPLWIGEQTNLTKLELDYNNLDGIITQSHLTKLVRLKALGLSYNSLTMAVDQHWVPPFKLYMASLRSCRLGPKFPEWLKSQSGMFILDISNTSIADSIPDWFWSTFSKTDYLILSRNQIRGTLPPMKFGKMESRGMDFSMNIFEGGLPKFSKNLTYLDLSRNSISGPLPLDFGAPILQSLLLFKNSLSGTIPNSICKLKYLQFVDLSGNLLQGPFPNCWDSLEEGNTSTSISGSSSSNPSLPMISKIFMLNLNGNNLSGPFPLFLQNCQGLIFLDLAFNQFSGSLPTWIGEKLSSLAFLRLRSNLFTGDIPPELSKMKDLQYLDLASNNFSGIIPGSLVNLEAMSHMPADKGPLSDVVYYGWSLWTSRYGTFIVSLKDPFNLATTYGPDFSYMDMLYNDSLSVVTKGQQLEFTTQIRFMVNFDLSCNSLTGHIPEEISALTALKSLNLSWNDLSGTIPRNIGALKSLESLDLSHNGLSGEIPKSISSLTVLSHLNLSYNNLSGPIPSGNQLQVLDNQASIYIGNPGLCGPPLSKNCSETRPPPPGVEDEDQDALFMYLGLGIGWATGLSTIYLILLLNLKWRIACFLFFDRLYDKVYVQVSLTWASLRRALLD